MECKLLEEDKKFLEAQPLGKLRFTLDSNFVLPIRDAPSDASIKRNHVIPIGVVS